MRGWTPSGLWLAIALELRYNTGVVTTTPMTNETYLEHIWVNIPARNVKIIDSEGYDEVVQYNFDKDGAEGFYETITSFKESVPQELVTYIA